MIIIADLLLNGQLVEKLFEGLHIFDYHIL